MIILGHLIFSRKETWICSGGKWKRGAVDWGATSVPFQRYGPVKGPCYNLYHRGKSDQSKSAQAVDRSGHKCKQNYKNGPQEEEGYLVALYPWQCRATVFQEEETTPRQSETSSSQLWKESWHYSLVHFSRWCCTHHSRWQRLQRIPGWSIYTRPSFLTVTPRNHMRCWTRRCLSMPSSIIKLAAKEVSMTLKPIFIFWCFHFGFVFEQAISGFAMSSIKSDLTTSDP